MDIIWKGKPIAVLNYKEIPSEEKFTQNVRRANRTLDSERRHFAFINV